MNIEKILTKAIKPPLYEKGTATMWTDTHISKQLLQVHLNVEVDLASRKMETILKTTEWILQKTSKKSLNILDLGCGPGLYAELLAQKGHRITGVDFSESSIKYAKKEAERKKLSISYITADYLELEMEDNSFDLVLLIFTDLGVLFPQEREKMIRFVNRILKSGGTFIFDVLNDKDLEKKLTRKNWEVTVQGFWKPEPYIALSESFLYKNEKVILYQHILLDKNENVDVYRFWTHFFSHSDLEIMLENSGFYDFKFSENVLPKGDLWNGNNVTFCAAVKD